MLEDIFGRKEDLHPDLKECIITGTSGLKFIKHKYLIAIYHEQMHALYNMQYAVKKQSIEEDLKFHRYDSYIFLHERPYRFEALRELLKMSDSSLHPNIKLTPSQKWKLISYVWTDSENIFENLDGWIDVWSKSPTGRTAHVMSESDKKVYKKLPRILTVYRGISLESAYFGMSWTLNRDVAMSFAKRASHFTKTDPVLLTSKIGKPAVMAYFNYRNEEEIVLLPDYLLEIEIEKVVAI